jgi:hypothetical protein
MIINGKRTEKPRFWLFKQAELMAFRKAAREHETSSPSSTPERVRITSAKPNSRLFAGGVRSRQEKQK